MLPVLRPFMPDRPSSGLPQSFLSLLNESPYLFKHHPKSWNSPRSGSDSCFFCGKTAEAPIKKLQKSFGKESGRRSARHKRTQGRQQAAYRPREKTGFYAHQSRIITNFYSYYSGNYFRIICNVESNTFFYIRQEVLYPFYLPCRINASIFLQKLLTFEIIPFHTYFNQQNVLHIIEFKPLSVGIASSLL